MKEAVFVVILVALPFALALFVAGCLAKVFRKDDANNVRTLAIIAASPFPATLVFTLVLAGVVGPGVADNGPQIMGGLMIMGTMLLIAPLLVSAGYSLALRILKSAR